MPPVFVDPDRLQQIVFNLVANAVKFTPAGTVEVRARVADAAASKCDVHDTGIGISAAFLPFVFDRFRQADGSTSRQYGGLGLGLSIVRSLVELHGGRVVAHSDGEGRGATFSVWLPADAPGAASSATRPPTPPQLNGGAEQRHRAGDRPGVHRPGRARGRRRDRRRGPAPARRA